MQPPVTLSAPSKESQVICVSVDAVRSYGKKVVSPWERRPRNAEMLGYLEMENKNGSPADDV